MSKHYVILIYMCQLPIAKNIINISMILKNHIISKHNSASLVFINEFLGAPLVLGEINPSDQIHLVKIYSINPDLCLKYSYLLFVRGDLSKPNAALSRMGHICPNPSVWVMTRVK